MNGDYEAWGFASMAFFGLVLSALYFAPAGVAAARGHPNRAAIAAVNVLLGWTVLGWVVALAWAVSSFDRARSARAGGGGGARRRGVRPPGRDHH